MAEGNRKKMQQTFTTLARRTAAHVATPRERNQEEESVRGNQMPLNTSEVYSVHVHVSNQRPSSSTQLAAAAVALIATKPEKQKE